MNIGMVEWQNRTYFCFSGVTNVTAWYICTKHQA